MKIPCSALGLGLLAVVSGTAASQETARESVKSNGGQANGNSWVVAMSSDGRCVVFNSDATNLVSNDTNRHRDVFVHDRDTGVTERVSVSSTGGEADDACYGWSISADGRLIAFWSFATNLVTGDSNNSADAFVHDRSTGITELVSWNASGGPANGETFFPSISADGRLVAFYSSSSDLVSSDSNGTYDIFVRDRQNGTTELVSVDSSGIQGNGASAFPAISPDGTLIAFNSDSTNLVTGDTNVSSDIFVHDRSTGITERVSVDSSGSEANDDSGYASISADGRVVAFQSKATNLCSNDGNWLDDVFVHDRSTGLTECMSLNASGSTGNDESRLPNLSVSADGRFVAFQSKASDLVSPDGNGGEDVFVRDRTTGMTEMVSVDSSGNQGNWLSQGGNISANGECIGFFSSSTNLVSNDTNNCSDAFVRDRCDAYWIEYGTGLTGTNGIPSLTAQADPVLGSLLNLDLDNSSGGASVGVLVVGFQRLEAATPWGGKLLVAPAFLSWLSLPAGITTITGSIPDLPALCDFAIDVQALEVDPGAAKGVSFSRGLELILGR